MNFSQLGQYGQARNKRDKTPELPVVSGVFTIRNDRGLHTRPSTELVRHANRFRSEIYLRHQQYYVNAKSLIGILMLAAAKGSKITIEACGSDAEQAVQSLINLAEEKFGINY